MSDGQASDGQASRDAGFHETAAPLPAEAEELWEVNAGWWQDSFTEGADPEYTEQIIPLLMEHLTEVTEHRAEVTEHRAEVTEHRAEAAPAWVLDIGCGEGQLSRLAAGVPGVRRVVGVDPTRAQLVAALARQPAGEGPAAAPGGETGPARAAAGAGAPRVRTGFG